jgi:hypothetical protein
MGHFCAADILRDVLNGPLVLVLGYRDVERSKATASRERGSPAAQRELFFSTPGSGFLHEIQKLSRRLSGLHFLFHTRKFVVGIFLLNFVQNT